MSFPFRISFPFDILETRMRAVPPPLLFALALLAVLVFAQGRALAWTAAEQVKTYPVYGQSGPELYTSIGENGPVISGNRRAIAHTTFKLTWGRDYREQADGSCVIARNVPKLIITYTLPKPREGLPQGVASNWKRFYDGLAAHERVHGQHIIDMVQAIQDVSVGLSAPNDPGCHKVRAELQTHLKRLSDEQRARGRAFDRVEMGDGGNVQQLVLGLLTGR
jgi:predicted secreted Zn-dependent protease